MYEYNWDEIKENPLVLTELLNKHGARGLARLVDITHTSVLKRTKKFGIEYNKDDDKWYPNINTTNKNNYTLENKENKIFRDESEDKYIILEGKEEYKPKYALKNNTYIVYYGRQGSNRVEISKEQLEELLDLYCVARLTIEQVSLKMGLTREEFYAIKTAFSITKSSLPFTPEQLDKYTADEIAEKHRIKKKQYSLKKYEVEKYKDIENRVKQMDKTHFWYRELCGLVNKIEPKPYRLDPKKQNEETLYVAYIADVHAGLEVDNYFNTYNINIMHERFAKLASEISANCEGKIYLCDLGDTVHGTIHGSTQKYSEWITQSILEVIKAYEQLFLTLLKQGYEVYFAKVNGNHESIEKAKTDRTEEENFGNIIYDVLKWKYSEQSNLYFIDKLKGLDATIVPIFDYSTLLVHGDDQSLRTLERSKGLFKEFNVKEVNAGHIHQRQIINDVYYNECFCGPDQYSGNKFLISDFGVRIAEYTKEGRSNEWLVKY